MPWEPVNGVAVLRAHMLELESDCGVDAAHAAGFTRCPGLTDGVFAVEIGPGHTARVVDAWNRTCVAIRAFEIISSLTPDQAKRLTQGQAAASSSHYLAADTCVVPMEAVFPLAPVQFEGRFFSSPNQQSAYMATCMQAGDEIPADHAQCYAWWTLFRREFPDMGPVGEVFE